MTARSTFLAALLLTVSVSGPATAQSNQTEGYKFLQAIKDEKGDDVIGFLEKPGATVINTRDIKNGDGALHIVVRRGNATYLGYLLGKQADPNLRNGNGETPLLLAAQAGRSDMIATLVKYGARIDQADSKGQTALIYAVQRHDLDLVHNLLDLGADPDRKDMLQGLSARDYAHQDARASAIATAIDAKPKTVRRGVSGPKL